MIVSSQAYVIVVGPVLVALRFYWLLRPDIQRMRGHAGKRRCSTKAASRNAGRGSLGQAAALDV